MSAPTASQSENIGDNIAAGFVTVLTQDTTGTTLAAFGPRMPLEMPKNRIEVRSGGFIRANDLMNFTATGTAYYNYRRGTLSVTVITQRHSHLVYNFFVVFIYARELKVLHVYFVSKKLVSFLLDVLSAIGEH